MRANRLQLIPMRTAQPLPTSVTLAQYIGFCAHVIGRTAAAPLTITNRSETSYRR